jgi:UDPglucose 6-dehydrogenase
MTAASFATFCDTLDILRGGFVQRTSVTTSGLHRIAAVEFLAHQDANSLRRIAVLGTGYVGLVAGTCFAELGNSVVCTDNDSRKIETLQNGELPFFEPQLLEMIESNRHAGRLVFSGDVEGAVRAASIVIVAVGTPMGKDESADLSAVWNAAATIGRALNGPKIVVLKSTVPVETSETVREIIERHAAKIYDVEVVSNPEFLREGTAVADFMHPDRIVIGTNSAQAEAAMRALYAGFEAPVLCTDVRTSEMIKYAANAFLATKISFMNEIANMCDLMDVDVKTVGTGIGFDHRIGTQFMNPGIGYGGSCLPKDVRALCSTARELGYEANLLRSVERVNATQIQRSVERIADGLGGRLDGAVVCVLGLAFKPNTSDVREAPALHLIELLLRSGARVTAHDPIALEGARAVSGDSVRYCSGIYEAIYGCDALVFATEWNEYKGVNFGEVRRLMRGDVIFDGRNMFEAARITSEGLRYIGVGRAKEPAPYLAYAEVAKV